MNNVKTATTKKSDKKTLNIIAQNLVKQEKDDVKSLQKVALMSYLSS